MTAPTAVRSELFGPARRATTVGIVLLISLVAFEAMGVGTTMPALVADLGGLALYAWPFVAFLAANVLGTVLGGRWCDRAGPRPPLLAGPLLFGAGLVVAGTAGTMAQLLAGRVLQGLGAGALAVSVFVLIAVVYPEPLRPAVFGLISAAWVLPALLGPPVSGFVTETVSWHWVFLGLVPLVFVATALVVPAVRPLGPPAAPAPGRRGTAAAALGAAVGVSALSWAAQNLSAQDPSAQNPGSVAAGVAVAAVLVLVPSLRVLLPRGVFRAGRGVPTVIASRGLLAGTFFGVNSYLPLVLTDTHGWTLTAAGIPLVLGALGWSGAAAWQGRRPDVPRARLLRTGFVLLAVGVGGIGLVVPEWGVAWLAVPFWIVAGAGMGLGFSSVSYLLLSGSPAGQVGFHTSAAQITDGLMVATTVGAGGALLALLGTPAAALPVLMAALAGLAVAGAVVAGRAAVE
ncbi:MFS transporter [Pseudonocardia hydrocarbonoxydans]|uniref:MFS transporter n=1 Tax=Pseudonocardia hydrocarbonoxydans TaxID=76726 RepID=A0A4Y3WU02_9PSEU|nr:MFS transporter [Pseudonocardia hydrocarbonoxydans]GEC22254.1 MFS transporter [Pseudonocardia hydrocarbonoxydans]